MIYLGWFEHILGIARVCLTAWQTLRFSNYSLWVTDIQLKSMLRCVTDNNVGVRFSLRHSL
jgi:hypothetical protein